MSGQPVDVAAYRALLALGVEEPHVVGLLSDEEVLALAEGEPDDLTALPWLASQPTVSAEVAATFGRRSLLMRGVVRATPDGTRVDPDLRLALALARGGRGYLRLTSDDGDAAALFVSVQPETGVVEEDVTRSGIHAYTIASYAEARRRAARWALDGRRGGTDAAPRRLRTQEWPELVATTCGEGVRSVSVEMYGIGPGGSDRLERRELAVGSRAALLLTPDDDPSTSTATAVDVDTLADAFGVVAAP